MRMSAAAAEGGIFAILFAPLSAAAKSANACVGCRARKKRNCGT
jgi:hypothetical protein